MLDLTRQIQAHDSIDRTLLPVPTPRHAWVNPLLHYTLNSGHCRAFRFRRNGFAVQITALLQLLVREAQGPVGYPNHYQFSIRQQRGADGALFTLARAGLPLLTCAVCWHPSAVPIWNKLRQLYEPLRVTSGPGFGQWYPCVPSTLPWLGVVLMPAIADEPPEAVRRLAALERWLAWTIIEVHQLQRN